jgi:hypothetical protein
MSESLLSDLMTPCGPTALYLALERAWPSVIVGPPSSRGALVLLVAHWALETGFGHGCHRWNLGNKKHVAGDGHDYVQFRCLEYDAAGKPYWIEPPDPACSFVAFATLDAGAADYLAGLHKHFGAAWLDVVAEDIPKFCADLRAAHYYTAPEKAYELGVLRCYAQLDATIPPDTLPELPNIEHPELVGDEIQTPPGDLTKVIA